jgi:hypothetical protein
MKYTTVENVSAFLQTAIGTSTTPTTAQVTNWIEENENELDWTLHTEFGTSKATDEILSYDSDSSKSSAHSFDYTGAYELPAKRDVIILPFKNCISLDKIEFNIQGSPSSTPDWVEGEVGWGKDAVLVEDSILLLNPNKTPIPTVNSIRVTVTYGHNSTPKLVQKIVTRMTALDFMRSSNTKDVSAGGGSIRVGDISLSEGGNFGIAFMAQTENEIDRLLNKLGTFNTYLI